MNVNVNPQLWAVLLNPVLSNEDEIIYLTSLNLG